MMPNTLMHTPAVADAGLVGQLACGGTEVRAGCDISCRVGRRCDTAARLFYLVNPFFVGENHD